jgi:hypothetical protein
MQSKKMHKQRQKRNATVKLEPLMKGVQEALYHDLSDEKLRRICTRYERGSAVPTSMGWPPYMFKKLQQLRNFDKRVIWSEDKSFDELSNEAFKGFKDSQKTFVLPEPMSRRVSLVIHLSAEICHRILGEFSFDEWFDSCSFGKRAAYKLPRRNAYLDERVYTSSGTALQKAAYNACLSRDVHLLRAVRSEKRSRQTVDRIRATSVPKSFKSARIIAPDTILGGFLSRGIGNVIRRKLEEETHIDLAKQQERHRRWAQKASVTGHYATIDMSKASDSFTWRHIECIVPKSWHHALSCVRVPTVEVGNDLIPLTSYMLMGSGHTFPLQTLLFYTLAEATRSLLNCRGRVSVYGDDIMIPVAMSSQFIVVMSELGFTINSEKSFYDSPDPDRPSHTFFRESCGGDYKGGIDVRPYMPECDLQSDGNVPSNVYIAWCHKMINGLLDRWEPYEIPVTLTYLLHAISSRKRKICFVPTWEVDHAGIRHYIPPYLTHGLECSDITYEHSVPSYWRLTFRRKKRKRRTRERPYVWYAYFLKRNCQIRSGLPFLHEILHLEDERSKRTKSYEAEVSLNGEPDRSRDGFYRWTKFGPVVAED